MENIDNIGIPMKYEHSTSCNELKFMSKEAREWCRDDNGHNVDIMYQEFEALMIKYDVRVIRLIYDAFKKIETY